MYCVEVELYFASENESESIHIVTHVHLFRKYAQNTLHRIRWL